MKISKTALWGTGLALVLSASALLAQGYGPGSGPMMGGGMMGGGMMGGGMMGGPMGGPMMGGGLNLTEAQQASAKAIRERHQAAMEAKLKTAGEARRAMEEVLRNPASSDAQVKEAHARVSDAMVNVMLERRAMEKEFEAILTADQKSILQNWGPGRGHHGRGMGGGGCGW